MLPSSPPLKLFNILNLNIRSIRDKADLLEEVLAEENVDAAIITEHWMSNEIIGELKIRGYNVIDHFCRPRGYGGVLLLANAKDKYESVIELKQFSIANTIEIAGMWSANYKQLIIGVYRPPQGSIEVFLEQMRCCLHSVFDKEVDLASIFVGGDFNTVNSGYFSPRG